MFVTRYKVRNLLEAEAAEMDSNLETNNSTGGDNNTSAKKLEPNSSTVEVMQASAEVDPSPDTTKSSSYIREPAYWRQHLENIKEMRKESNAPVDSMGALACVDPDATEPIRRFQVLLALMLSSQTKDEVTWAAMKKLKENGACTPLKISELSQEKISELIYPVGFYKRKGEYIKKVVDILNAKYNGDIPSTYEELCALPGVGPKMATLTMNLGWKRTVGVGVDTHVHRIANRLGWTLLRTKSPEETAEIIEKWLPKDVWDDVNLLFVGFGQQICTPTRPKCEECLNQSICPYGLGN